MDVFNITELDFAVFVVSTLAAILVAAPLQFVSLGIHPGSRVVDHYHFLQVDLV